MSSAADRPTRWQAARTAALLGALFVVVYGGCSFLTSLRGDVGTWYYAWERHIPFLPIFILPYLSIDAFYISAPFLCRTRDDLRVLAGRITLAVLVAGVCFLLFPLQLAVERPTAPGAMGAAFAAFVSLDKPFNLFPSLHIALGCILGTFFAQRFAGVWRWLLIGWFVLVTTSTLFTYQHHFVDVVGGAVLALLCFHFVRPGGPTERQANPRLGIYYLALAALCGAGATLGGAWLLLLWPTLSGSLLALAYFGRGPAVFLKEDGRISFVSRALFAPVLLAQRLSLAHYRRQAQAWNELTPQVWIGRRLDPPEAADAVRQGVTAVLDLTGEFDEAPAFLGVEYLNLPVLDLTAPTPAQLDAAVAFIEAQSARGIVYVHCKIGFSRTAAATGVWLRRTGRAADAEEALRQLRAARPGIVIRPEAEHVIRVG